MTTTLLVGDAIDMLRTLPNGVARCCVTSPPYWGLRSYFPDGVRLRDDLSDEVREAVLRELAAMGVVPIHVAR